jgi:hypothetical protein
MCDLTKRGIPAALPRLPKGLALDVADLFSSDVGLTATISAWWFGLITAPQWTRNMRRLIAFQTKVGPFYRWIIGRHAEAVFVQP